MNPTRITKDLVFQTADQIQRDGVKVSVIKVYQAIGSGSMSTVHKYLKEWKEQQVNGVRLDPLKLKQQLVEQLKICENLTSEFLNSRQLVASQSAQNTKLETRVLELEARLAEKELMHREMIAHLTFNNQQLKESFDATVSMLTQQLSAINEQAIRKVQEAGYHFDTVVLEGKLELRYLKEQLELKDKDLKKLKSLETTGLLAQRSR